MMQLYLITRVVIGVSDLRKITERIVAVVAEFSPIVVLKPQLVAI